MPSRASGMWCQTSGARNLQSRADGTCCQTEELEIYAAGPAAHVAGPELEIYKAGQMAHVAGQRSLKSTEPGRWHILPSRHGNTLCNEGAPKLFHSA